MIARHNRREFLRLAGFAASGLCLPSELSWALPQNLTQRQGSAQRVTILGAGLAGLAAGWELKSAGHDVTIRKSETKFPRKGGVDRRECSAGYDPRRGTGRAGSGMGTEERGARRYHQKIGNEVSKKGRGGPTGVLSGLRSSARDWPGWQRDGN